MWIQILLIAAFLTVAFLDFRAGGGGARHLAIRRLFFIAVVGLAILSILFPEWLSWLAERLGVGRGTDLLLYVVIVAFVSHVVALHRRNAATDRKITALARRVALDEAQRSGHQLPGRTAPDPAPPPAE